LGELNFFAKLLRALSGFGALSPTVECTLTWLEVGAVLAIVAPAAQMSVTAQVPAMGPG
jgi:hypothetical protein